MCCFTYPNLQGEKGVGGVLGKTSVMEGKRHVLWGLKKSVQNIFIAFLDFLKQNLEGPVVSPWQNFQFFLTILGFIFVITLAYFA